MYPELLLPLAATVGAACGILAFLLLRRPVLRRLALRQASRRRTEAMLVIIGSALGTTIIVGSLVVGDTLNFSVKQDAYRTLGPVDERVVSLDPVAGQVVALALNNLRSDPFVDGVLTAHSEQAAVVLARKGRQAAEPRTLVWDVDFRAAEQFGGSGAASGLSGPSPRPSEVVLNDLLAADLGARVGDSVLLYLYDRPTPLWVTRIVPARGLAGGGFGTSANRNAFLAPGTLVEAGAKTGRIWPRTVTLVSNRGDVEGGNRYSDRVAANIRQIIAPLSAAGTAVETPKKDVLAEAKVTGDALGALFLFIGSFSIIAGVLLLMNIFVMLGEERKGQLGMLRAVGMKRSRLVGSFLLEGALYAVAAAAIGTLAGIGVGRAVASLAARVFGGWSADGSGLDISFAVSSTSLINGFAMGLIIALATVLLTSIRISRLNVIAAIRDLAPEAGRRIRTRWVVLSTLLAGLMTVASILVVARGRGAAVYLVPALAVLLAVPLLRRLARPRWVYTIAAGAILVWGLTANLVRPHLFDDASTSTYIVLGAMLTFSAVFVVSENQNLVLWPLRRLMERPSPSGLAIRLAVAYPLARKFRTGATLIMYSIVVFTIVLIAEISAVIDASVDTSIAQATAGYSVRVDYNPNAPVRDPTRTLRAGPLARQVQAVAPLRVVTAGATDPGRRTTTPLRSVVVGLPAQSMATGFRLDARLPGQPDDKAVWSLVARDGRYVVLDRFFGSTGGPPGQAYQPGDTFWLTDPRTGRGQQKTIAGILQDGTSFYSVGFTPSGAFPVVMSATGVQDQFGSAAQVSSALLRVAPGTNERALLSSLQGDFISSSLVATSIRQVVERQFAANRGFFQLMLGFLALGLVVCLTGLGVVMVRAVRERRRTIGVLRALGFRTGTVHRSFMLESSFIALEGILLGVGLSILTSWLLVRNSSAFQGLAVGFVVDWPTILVLVVSTFVASLLVTAGPARRAARILPALAVRVDN
jgi:putative ABC transport system permease protein